MTVRFQGPLDLGLAAPEIGHPIRLTGPLGQLGEPFQRLCGRGVEPEPLLEDRRFRARIAALFVQPRQQCEPLSGLKLSGA